MANFMGTSKKAGKNSNKISLDHSRIKDESEL
jgi:hypothetical protein